MLTRVRVEIELWVDDVEAAADMLIDQVALAYDRFADAESDELVGGYTARLVVMEN